MPHYTTRIQADTDAARLLITSHVGTVPVHLLCHIEAVARDLRSNSDTLLITADALREAAEVVGSPSIGRALLRLADTLAEIAPSRATPIPEAE